MSWTLALTVLCTVVMHHGRCSSATLNNARGSIVVNELSDWEKLTTALGGLSFSSVDELLEKIGLADMPKAHLYGIVGGCVTFAVTLMVVATLLFRGGTFQRLYEQLQMPQPKVLPASQNKQKQSNRVATTGPMGRPLLYERLLETRDRMMRANYPDKYRKDCTNGCLTTLTSMLLNVVPPPKFDKKNLDKSKVEPSDQNNGLLSFVSKLVMDRRIDTDSNDATHTTTINTNEQQLERKKWPTYEERYIHAYRRCQSNPGGRSVPGNPDARMEAYACAYASCPPLSSPTYRRSYARIYEDISCVSQDTIKYFFPLMQSYPQDIFGRKIRLQPLDPKVHAEELFHSLITESADDESMWYFSEYGPFQDPNEMADSHLFQRLPGEAAFAIYQHDTENLIGCIMLGNDDPKNLSIELDACFTATQQVSSSSDEELEACFLILDRLFGLHYRRVYMVCDVADARKNKLAARLGFLLEGTLPKYRIIKDANSDSNILALTNSEWGKGGVREGLFKKLHGSKALATGIKHESRESELDLQELNHQ